MKNGFASQRMKKMTNVVTPFTFNTSKHLDKIEIPYLKDDQAPKTRFQNPSSSYFELQPNGHLPERNEHQPSLETRREADFSEGLWRFWSEMVRFELEVEEKWRRRERGEAVGCFEEEEGFLAPISYTPHTYTLTPNCTTHPQVTCVNQINPNHI